MALNLDVQASGELEKELAVKVETKIQDTENKLINLDKEISPKIVLDGLCKDAQNKTVQKSQENSQEAKEVLVKAKKHLRDQDYFAAIENLEFSQNIVKRVETTLDKKIDDKCPPKDTSINIPEELPTKKSE